MTEKIILLLNRDTAFLDQTGAILESAGYHIRSAVEMRGALAVLSSCPVGLVICDKELRDVSGFDLLNFIKKDPLREKIPFIYLVSAKDQGGAFKAFELGAVDYFVHPLEPRILIGRVNEIFAKGGLPAPSGAKPDETEAQPQSSAGEQAQDAPDDRVGIPALVIEVSRDGVIWLPGKITAFGRERLFIETSLFGKAGVSLMARVKSADATFVLNGYIKEIAFDGFQKPAIIEMHTRAEDAWRHVHAELKARSQEAPTEAGALEGPTGLEKTIVLNADRAEKTVFRTGPFQPSPSGRSSYDLRFYYSIIGKQLDNYRAITLIGAGSMGGVIQGWDVALEREVALKVISYELSSKEKFREMFVREARVVSRLNHVNIAQIYYIGTSSDILYYAMEFVDGPTLKDLIASQGNLNTLKGLEHLITVCQALSYVHQNSIVHRDMKPANIMINGTGMVKIVDFGVAAVGDADRQKSSKGQTIGSPLYMSPEQVAGLAVDYRSDIYSLGATFYHVFAGAPPFAGEDYKDIMSRHINTPLPDMREKNPKIPAALAKIIARMMAKDPLERYKDLQHAAGDVKALCARIVDRKRRPASGNASCS